MHNSISEVMDSEVQIGSSKLQMEEQETETLLPQVHNSEVMDSEVQIGSSKLQMEEQETETYP